MRRVEHAVKAIEKDITGKKILEAACGCAEFSICAAAEAAAVVCIDLDDGRLLPETAACGNLAFARMDSWFLIQTICMNMTLQIRVPGKCWHG